MTHLDLRSLVDLTDDLLATEQAMPRWVTAAWSDALNGVSADVAPVDDGT